MLKESNELIIQTPLSCKLAAVFCITFNLNSLIEQTTMTNERYAVVSSIIMVLLFISCRVGNGIPLTIEKKPFLYICACSFLLLLTAVFNADFSILYFVIMLELFKAFLLSQMLDFREFANIFVVIVSVLAIVSVVGFILANTFSGFRSLGKMVTNHSGLRYRSFGLFYLLNDGNRNTGFLSEPGDWQHYANIALCFELFCLDELPKKGVRKLFPIFLTLVSLTALSPVGLIFSSAIWTGYFITTSTDRSKTIRNLLVFAGAVVLMMNSSFMRRGLQYASSKLNGTYTTSLSVRLFSLLAGLKAGLRNPLLGVGITCATDVMANLFQKKGLVYNHTSTTMAFFAMFGFPFLLLVTIPYFKCFCVAIKRKASLGVCWIIIVAILISINNERFIYELTYYLFVIYGFRFSEIEPSNEY